eukprot:16446485-Heterocapsa_arctica.AAC.1
MDTKQKRCDKFLRSHRAFWEELLEPVQATWDEVVWPSVTSFRAKAPGQAVPAWLRDEYQIKTKGLLTVLFGTMARGRTKDIKDNARDILLSLLQCVSPTPLADFSPSLVPPDLQSLCPEAPENGALCQHLHEKLAGALALDDKTEHEVFLQCMGIVSSMALMCPASSAFYKHQVNKLVVFVDEQIVLHGHGDALHAEHVVLQGPITNRRVDQDLRLAIVQTAMETKKAKTPMALARAGACGNLVSSTVAGWIPKHMAHVRASLFLSFKNAQHVSIAFDAGRIGSPKEETLTIVALI